MAKRNEFNAQKARTKYACPIWVDAFLRDTLYLEADEIGAYHLIIYAMWTRDSCDFPDDDRKLARVCRCSLRLWRSRIRGALEPFFDIENGLWISGRLCKEAAKTEVFLQAQSDRRSGGDAKSTTCALPEGTHEHSQENDQNSPNPLESIEAGSSGDSTTDLSGEHPTQETKRPSILGGGGEGCAGAREAGPPDAEPPPYEPPEIHDPPPKPDTFREQLLVAVGADPVSGLVGPNGRILGTQADMLAAERWRDLGLSDGEILREVRDVMARKRDGPPGSLTYFDNAMARLAGQKQRPALKVINPTSGAEHEHRDRNRRSPDMRENRADPAIEQIARLAGLGATSGDGGV